jgi:hypothetical protein
MNTNDPAYQEFLAQLTEGLDVCRVGSHTWGKPRVQLGRVTKVTATQALVEFDHNGRRWAERYRRKNGSALSGSAAYIRPITQADHDEIERFELCEWVRDLAHAIESGKKYPLANLRAMRHAFEHPDGQKVECKASPSTKHQRDHGPACVHCGHVVLKLDDGRDTDAG